MAAGKKKRSQKRWNRRNKEIRMQGAFTRTQLGPTETLVGFHGKVAKKKLRPPRRSRADKQWERRLRQEYEEQSYRLERQTKYHSNLLSQIKEAEEKAACPELIQELHELLIISSKCLRYLCKGKETHDPQGAMGKNGRHLVKQRERKSNSVIRDKVKKVEKQTSLPVPSKSEDESIRRCREGAREGISSIQSPPECNVHSPPLQLYVYGLPSYQVLTLRELYLDDKGRDLINAIRRSAGRLPRRCVFRHGHRLIEENCSLETQGIVNETNIHMSFHLLGGMETAEQTVHGKDPRCWTKERVGEWIDSVCENFQIDKEDVAELKTLNGAGLSRLSKENWIGRSKQGDFLFDEWQTIIRPEEICEEDDTSEEDNVLVDVVADVSSYVKTDEEICHNQPVPSVEVSIDQQSTNGPFGETEDLNVVPDVLTLDEMISSTIPCDGSVIAVRGICSSMPVKRGAAGSVLLRNDPDGDSQYIQLKVDFRSSPSSTLTKYKIDNILQVVLGDEIAIRGRIEPLEEGFVSKREGFTMLSVKVVVDADTHAAVRKSKKSVSSFVRQLSTPLPLLYGAFPAEVCSQPLHLGDSFIRGENDILLPAGTNPGKVKEYVVALRNCKTGDIFIGVNAKGKITGESVPKERINQKREDLCKTIGRILPAVDSEICICQSALDAAEMSSSNKSFIAFMWLQGSDDSEATEQEENDVISVLVHIHITKGSRPIHFTKQSDTHAFVRVGTETKKMSDYDELDNRLESLAWRNLVCDESHIKQEVKKASILHETSTKYKVFKRLQSETERKEFKAIYGNPKQIILKDYIADYTAAFLNTQGGEIFFGVEEDRASKIGYVTGLALSPEARKQLLRESAEQICNFWPPVKSCHFLMTFIDIDSDGVFLHALKYPKTSIGKSEQPILLRMSSLQEIEKMKKLIKENLRSEGNMVTLVRVKEHCFCILAENSSSVNVEQFLCDIEKPLKQLRNVSLECIPVEELYAIAEQFCVVRLKVEKSPYPIHLTQPLLTYVIDEDGCLRNMESEEMLDRFKRKAKKDSFDVKAFMNLTSGFDKSQCSFILMTAPMELSREERDLLGLVIPEWTMVLDFDQHLTSDGHLYNVVKPTHDLHQGERNLFLKTPCDRKIEVNSDNGVCWYAVRGYDELGDTLSKPGHGEWNIKHGDNIKSHLKNELIMHVNPNHLVLVCYWTEAQEEILSSMQMLVEQIFSSWSRTSVIFVCSNERAKKVLLEKLVEPLENSYSHHIKKENVFVVPIHHLSRHLATELDTPFQPENNFQLPKKHVGSNERVVPETLPQYVRQAIQGHLQMMYLKTGQLASKEEISEEKKKFFSGSAIGSVGLAHNIGFKREKLKEVKTELTSMLNDKRSHVCMVVVKAERGSGATTLCRQLLYDLHKHYPCAQLTEFHKSLITNIDKINKHTNLPLLLFVDSDIAHLQDFTDFKLEAERRNIDVIFVVVDSEVTFNKVSKVKTKPARRTLITPYTAGSAPYKIIELRRELDKDEIPLLVEQLLQLDCISDEVEAKLQKLQQNAKKDKSFRKFAYFSLTVFGKDFTRLEDYVRYRLDKTSEMQALIVDFLAVTHAFTESYFPVNALSKMIDEKVVLLESVFDSADVLELLSPPLKGKGGRRISFGEVAEEILKQRASAQNLQYVQFLKTTALRMARDVLAARERSKRIDRLSRRLFITSEYACQKFSPLILYMNQVDKRIACQTLLELSEIFPDDSSLWAHLKAHLAKYYMLEHKDFEKALPCIENAIKDHTNDSLLHHIHGDVIRLHIQNLKSSKEIDLKEIVSWAIRSCACFETVRAKRPLQDYGYTSDALVKRIVMEAAVKSMGPKCCYADYLARRLNDFSNAESKEPLHVEDKFVLSLIPEALGLLQDVQMDEYTENNRRAIISSMGPHEKLHSCFKELERLFSGTCDEVWVSEVILRTKVCIIGTKGDQRSPKDADNILASIAQLAKSGDERSMRTWIRHIRNASTVPRLQMVMQRVRSWFDATQGDSLHASYYKYVLTVLIALQDPENKEKMSTARKAIESVRRKRHLRNQYSSHMEWLHTKDGRDINSFDCLLHNDDLMKEYLNKKGRAFQTQGRPQTEIIEKALFEQNITKWEGVVQSKDTDWKGTICMKSHIPVYFVPAHIRPSLPPSGEKVQFYLSFDWSGPHAWGVLWQPGQNKGWKAKDIRPATPLPEEPEDESDSEESDDDPEHSFVNPEPLYRKQSSMAPSQVHDPWEEFLGKEMQGIVKFADQKGFGAVTSPKVSATLFFHKSELLLPTTHVSEGTVLQFVVGKDEHRCRALNIRKVQAGEEIDKDLVEVLTKNQGKENSVLAQSTPQQNTRLEGVIVALLPEKGGKTHGFIKPDNLSDDIFFHAKESGIGEGKMSKVEIGNRVQFSIGCNDKGRIAKDVYVQVEEQKFPPPHHATPPPGMHTRDVQGMHTRNVQGMHTRDVQGMHTRDVQGFRPPQYQLPGLNMPHI